MTATMATAPSDNAPHILLWYLGFHRFVLSDDRWAPLRPLYPIQPAQLADLEAMRRLHYAVMCHIHHSLDPALLDLFRAAVDAYVRGELGVPSIPGEAGKGFDETGYVHLPAVGPDIIADMRDYLADKKVRRGMYTGAGDLCAVDEARDANIANFPAETVAACPHLLDIANDPETLAAVERHLGTTPMILGFNAWWSFAGADEAKDAQLFHLDNADYYFCKLFIQLTDVDGEAGPHAFMEGTHDPTHVARLRDAWPEGAEAFNQWYFLTLRKTDADTRRYLGAEPVYFTGPAGSRFIVNTRGIHKGLLPRGKDRLICQVLYGITPHIQGPQAREGVFPLTAGRPPLAPESARLATDPALAYVNRLFVAAP